mgnify:CR=1 FL=1
MVKENIEPNIPSESERHEGETEIKLKVMTTVNDTEEIMVTNILEDYEQE